MLEHVPVYFISRSVAEIVRVDCRDIFLTIVMKRSRFDPPSPDKPRIHLTVMPRAFWDAIFRAHGCIVNKDLREKLKNMNFRLATTIFPYNASTLMPQYLGAQINFLITQFPSRENGNKEMCNFGYMEFFDVCFSSSTFATPYPESNMAFFYPRRFIGAIGVIWNCVQAAVFASKVDKIDKVNEETQPLADVKY